MYVLRETGGAIRMQQRVNYGPSCFIPYLRNKAASDGATDNLLVGSFEKQLMVYRGARLAWASTMGDVPVALAVSKFAYGCVVACTVPRCYWVSPCALHNPHRLLGAVA